MFIVIFINIWSDILSFQMDSLIKSHYLLQKIQSVLDIRRLFSTFLLKVSGTFDDKLSKNGRGFSEKLKSPDIKKKDSGFLVNNSLIHY